MVVRVMIIAVMLTAGGCGEASKAQAQASVTVKLPPARPYTPKPAFSFGSAPRAS
jgi:hypothetical protein